jgi:hypothetical protein
VLFAELDELMTDPPDMPDSRKHSKVLFDKLDKLITAIDESDELNTDELKVDTDELKIDTDELKIDTNKLKLDTNKPKLDTFDKLDELLRTVEKRDLAAFQRVNFVYDFEGNDPDIDKLELRTARFLSSLPHVQTLQLEGWALTGRLLQRTIGKGALMPFRELKTVIWGSHDSPLDELLPLWRLSVEHIEVRVAEPVARSRKDWPAPTPSLRKLNLHRSTITDRAFADLLNLSPRLELLRYDHLCHVDCK